MNTTEPLSVTDCVTFVLLMTKMLHDLPVGRVQAIVLGV